MLRRLSVRTLIATVAVLFFPAHSMFASPSHRYDLSGTVISVAHDSGFVYGVESSDSVYTMICSRSRFRQEKCDWNGHPVAVGDQVRFRIKGGYAFMPVDTDGEERFTVLMTELKRLPPLPSAPSGLEGAVVRGAGFTSSGSIPSPSAITAPGSSPGSMAPVVAVPTTGGAPVVVIPSAPVTSPVITGVPTTGGAPITAIAVGPPADATPSVTPPAIFSDSGSQWMRILRVQTANYIYDLTCDTNNCKLNGKSIQLGDSLTVRIAKKRMYVSSAGKRPERRFAILATHNADKALQ